MQNVSQLTPLLISVLAFGIILVGAGFIIRTLAPQIGIRLTKVGGQISLLSLVGILVIPFLMEYVGSKISGLVLALVGIPFGLMILQNALNLLFGPNVGSRVIAEIIIGGLRAIWRLISAPLAAIGLLGRRQD